MNNNLNQQFNNLRDLYSRKLGEYNSLKNRFSLCETSISNLQSKEELIKKSSIFLQSLSDQTRVNTLDKISQIVTDGLQVVKDKNLEFKMRLKIERNQPSLEMAVYDKITDAEYNVLDSMGGGIADIVSFLLRIALLTKWKPALSRIVLSDEGLKFVSVKDQEKLAEFIRTLCEKLKLQLILVTHSETLANASHKCFEVHKENGISKVNEKI